jgi:hypothetical protein
MPDMICKTIFVTVRSDANVTFSVDIIGDAVNFKRHASDYSL